MAGGKKLLRVKTIVIGPKRYIIMTRVIDIKKPPV
jgi:hypothetical protein